MKEQLISFDTAKLAKEKGFDIPTLHFWNFHKNNKKGLPRLKYQSWAMSSLEADLYENGQTKEKWELYAPTQSLLQKWLREKHNINLFIIKQISCCWVWTIWGKSGSNHMKKL